MTAAGAGVVLPKAASAPAIAAALLRVLGSAAARATAIDALVAAEALAAGLGSSSDATPARKARQLLEAVAAGGVDNPLQRLVDPAWGAVYAAPGGASPWSALTTAAGLGALGAVLLPLLVCAATCGWAVRACLRIATRVAHPPSRPKLE